MNLRHASRLFARQPVFTVTAIATLALGIGANTAIFTVVNGILLRPLPYKDSNRLAMLWMRYSGIDAAFRPSVFAPLSERARSFEEIAAYQYESFNLTGDQQPERIQGIVASPAIFPLLGVTPERGRTFLANEERAAVISHDLWQRRFSLDPSILSKAVDLNGIPHTIVGILPAGFDLVTGGNMPRGFRFATHTDIWTPLVFDRSSGRTYLQALAKLRPGVTFAAGQSELSAVAESIHRDGREEPDLELRIVPLQEQVAGRIRPALFILISAVALVLLIVCANLANLLMARAPLRQREIAVRAAIGASANRILRQLLGENLLLGLAGGSLGLLLAWWAVGLLRQIAPEDVPQFRSGLDLRVLGFSFAISALASLLFGLLPAARLARADLHTALKLGARAACGRSRLRNALVVSQLATSLILLAGAGLLLRSFERILQSDPGFRADHVLTAQLAIPEARYPRIQDVSALLDRALESISRQPGIETSGAASVIPMGGLDRDFPGFRLEDRPPFRDGELGPVSNSWVGGDYFRALRIPLRYGRYFATQEPANVAIMNENLARKLWGSVDPTGRSLVLWFLRDKPKFRLVGIVADVKHAGLDLDPPSRVYFPASQVPVASLTFLLRPMTLVLRTAGDPLGVVPAVRAAVLEADRDQPVSNFRTMDSLVAESLAGRKFLMILVVLFGALAMSLAGVGLYGVVSYSVSARTAEIGVRIALGARRTDVLRMILGEALALAAAGVAIGTAGALATSRVISQQLYGIAPTDALTFAAVAALLASVALIATLIPARRAMDVDPMVALRHE